LIRFAKAVPLIRFAKAVPLIRFAKAVPLIRFAKAVNFQPVYGSDINFTDVVYPQLSDTLGIYFP